MAIDPYQGFTSDVIKDPKRFVGRVDVIKNCIDAINAPLSMIAVFGKRGIGKSSLLRQIQSMANGEYGLPKFSGLAHLIPKRPRKYLTVYYQCDSLIKNINELIERLLNDQDEEDGLLRLVPNDGKNIVEFTRTKGVKGGVDLKVVNWGVHGTEASKYAKTVPGNSIQTFRNYIQSILTHQVKRLNYDGLLFILDEFDVIQDKQGMASMIKSLSGEHVKFCICGIANSISSLVADHESLNRLLREGSIPLRPMPDYEIKEIFRRAEQLFEGAVIFDDTAVNKIADSSCGYPYFAQMIGVECVKKLKNDVTVVDEAVYSDVGKQISSGVSFPDLEAQYIRAAGESDGRKWLLYLLANQDEDNVLFNDDIGRVVLSKARKEAEQLGVEYVDQLLPRLIDKQYGGVLIKDQSRRGLYEFKDPLFRLYVRIREI
jgi:Cdc6-like AAA superfamily ATPase